MRDQIRMRQVEIDLTISERMEIFFQPESNIVDHHIQVVLLQIDLCVNRTNLTLMILAEMRALDGTTSGVELLRDIGW